jgi:hypothetical protein
MVRISPSWQYNLSTPSVEDGGNVSRSMSVVATFWLALVKVGHPPPSPLTADGGSHSLGLSLGGGEVHR